MDDGAYFVINRARQYGKTTTLRALSDYLFDDVNHEYSKCSNQRKIRRDYYKWSMSSGFTHVSQAWGIEGVKQAVKIILTEKNTLFESLIGKLIEYEELEKKVYSILFGGETILYNPDQPDIDVALMFGFIKNVHGEAKISNRIFEMRLYNYFLTKNKLAKIAKRMLESRK